MSADVVFITHVPQNDDGDTEEHHFKPAHLGCPLPADDAFAAMFHNKDDD